MKQFILFSTLVIGIISSTYAQTKNFIDQPYIEVTGEAEIEIFPNEIYLKIQLEEKNFKGQSLSQVEREMITKLEAIGINTAEDLAIEDLIRNLKRYWIKPDDAQTSKVYQLKVNSAQKAGAVLQALEDIKVSNVIVEKFSHSDLASYKDQVKVAALQAAKEKATGLAKAINQTCGKALYIEEIGLPSYVGNSQGQVIANMYIRKQEGSTETIPEISFESIRLKYSILTRFMLN